MTEKLYYADSHIHEFEARIIDCEKCHDGYEVTLDRTAFFPEGGGQLADTGYIGTARVLDVQEKQGRILHFTKTALNPGERAACSLDWEQRRRRMQNHSGEHVVSGLCHSLYGYNNVGFHMGESFMSLDFDGELSWEQLTDIETRANAAVRDNLPVQASFPTAAELAKLDYRSKLELTENVRIVEIEGIDCCACCAPHVAYTGEIGVIKVLDAERHRGGMRVSLVCGMDALDNYRLRQNSVAAISVALSVKRDEVAQALERVMAEQLRLKERAARLGMRAAELLAQSYEYRQGNICVFDSVLDEIALRELVNMLTERCSGMAAAFSEIEGEAYKYIIGSHSIDLRKNSKAINAAINGRGGGSPEMIQGRALAGRKEIEKFFENAYV